MYTPHPTPAADECITCTRTLCDLPHTCGKDEGIHHVGPVTIQEAFDAVFGAERWYTVSRGAARRLGPPQGCGDWLITDHCGTSAAAAILKWAVIDGDPAYGDRMQRLYGTRYTLAAQEAYAEILIICNG